MIELVLDSISSFEKLKANQPRPDKEFLRETVQSMKSRLMSSRGTSQMSGREHKVTVQKLIDEDYF